MELKMEVTQKQILSQHMIQSMEILQMSTAELESYIENLSLENPVVDLEHSYENTDKTATQIDLQRKLDWLESTDRQNHVYYQQDRDNDSLQDSWNISDSGGEQLSEYLMAQLITAPYSPSEREIVNYLILSLDSRGYLTEDIISVARHFHTDIALVEKAAWRHPGAGSCRCRRKRPEGMSAAAGTQTPEFFRNDRRTDQKSPGRYRKKSPGLHCQTAACIC